MSDLIYYKKNVGYVVGGRWNPTDTTGWTLTNQNPYLAVKTEIIRDFKNANKRILLEGLIIPTEEPILDWETPNAVSDEQARELVKVPYLALKNQIALITSAPVMSQIVEIAKEVERPRKTIKLLEERLEELKEPMDDFAKEALERRQALLQ